MPRATKFPVCEQRSTTSPSSADLETADLGHHDIEEYQIRMPGIDLAERFLAVRRGRSLIFGIAEVGFQKLHPLRIVVGNQYPRRFGRRSGSRRSCHTSAL